jgi:hypothetical protein
MCRCINVLFFANICFDSRDVIAKCIQFVRRMISGVLHQLSFSHAIHHTILPHPLSIRKKYTMQISHKYKSSLLAILEG